MRLGAVASCATASASFRSVSPTAGVTLAQANAAYHPRFPRFDDYTGVCLSNCLDFGFGSDFALDKGNCSAGHTCVPCFDDGKPTGAPGCN